MKHYMFYFVDITSNQVIHRIRTEKYISEEEEFAILLKAIKEASEKGERYIIIKVFDCSILDKLKSYGYRVQEWLDVINYKIKKENKYKDADEREELITIPANVKGNYYYRISW